MSNNLSLLSITKDIFNTISRACVLIIFFMYLAETIGQHQVEGFIGITFIFITCFADYYARKCCNNIIVFMLVYIIMIPAMLILPIPDAEKVVLGTYLALTYYLALKFWVSENTSKLKCVFVFPSETLVLIIPLYVHSIFRLSDRLTNYILILSIIFISLNFVDQFLDKLLTYMLSIPSGSIIPLTKVFVTNLTSIGVILLIAVFVIFGISDLAFGDGILLKAVLFISGILAKMFVGCANVSQMIKTGEPSVIEEESTTASPGNQLESEVATSVMPNETIAYISRILSMALLVAFAIFVIHLIIKFITAYFKKESLGNEVIEKADTIISEKTKKTKRKLSLFKAKNNNDKARKIYKKKILSYNHTFINIDDTDTPSDLERKIKNKSGDNLKDLTAIYEAARYSNNVISDSELSIVKKISKK